MTVTLRYICPCPAAVPLSRTDWLIVVVAEAPMGRLLAADPDAVVTLVCQRRRRKRNYSILFSPDLTRTKVQRGAYSCGAGGLRRGAAGWTRLTTSGQSCLQERKEKHFNMRTKTKQIKGNPHDYTPTLL